MKQAVFIIAFLLCMGIAQGFAALKITCEGSWSARYIPEPGFAGSDALWFDAGQGNVSVREMFYPGDAVALNLPDGVYGYKVATLTGTVVESGTFELRSPFTVRFERAEAARAFFAVRADEPVFVEGYLLLEGRITDYKRFALDGSRDVIIEGLLPGTEYAARFMTDGFYREVGFTTPYRNAALGMPVTGTFTRLPESRFVNDSTPAITRVNDGSTEWLTGSAVSGEVNGGEQFFVVNLLRPTRLREARIVWSANYYPERYAFVWSDDGTNWSSMERLGADCEAGIAPDNSPIATDRITTNVTARYAGVTIKKDEKVIARVPGRNTVQIMEFEAYE